MNTLRQLRTNLQTALGAGGITVLDHMPERLAPPVAIILPGSPYLEGGSSFGSFAVRHTVEVVAAYATNDTATHALDEAITRVLVALDAVDYLIERVDAPTMVAHGGTHYLATGIDVIATVTGIDDGQEE